MSSPFLCDKTVLMETTLEYLGVRHRRNAQGWQKVRCPGPAHVHGDRTPSASVSLAAGKFHCHACDLHGDGFDVMYAVRDMTAASVLDAFGMSTTPREAPSEWLL